jgi:hypothetical protein
MRIGICWGRGGFRAITVSTNSSAIVVLDVNGLTGVSQPAFNASLAVLGILAIKRIPAYAADLAAFSVTELRHLLDSALEILDGLDGGSEIITRCRAALAQLLRELDQDGEFGY